MNQPHRGPGRVAPCEREPTAAELEFRHAIEAYQKSSGRMFPTWSEILEVIRSLGYGKPGYGGSMKFPSS